MNSIITNAPAFPLLSYHEGVLHVEAVPLTELAAAANTPLYVYSQTELLGRAAAYRDTLAAITPHGQVCYAIKANGNLALLKLLAQAGLGADVTSGGELFLALQAGFPPAKIVFSGVGKRPDEIAFALENRIHALHVESAQELEVIAGLAAAAQQKVTITLRINPNIAAATHPYISTGGKTHKFGVSSDVAWQMAQFAAAQPWLELTGLALHIGSQITDLAPFAQAVQLLIELANQYRAHGIPITYLDVGGGLGIDYSTTPIPSLERGNGVIPEITQWVETVARPIAAAGYHILMEPGRSIVGPTGVLVTQVLYTKLQGEQPFAITDAGMTDLIRPALYQAHHPIVPVRPRPGTVTPIHLVGPVCETSDVLATARPLPPLNAGDYLAVLQAGAYGYAMSSNYNGRLRPAEIMVKGTEWQVIRGREQYHHLLPQP